MASTTPSLVGIAKNPDYTKTEIEIIKGDLKAAYREILKEELFPNDAKYLLVALKSFFWKLNRKEVTLSDKSLITKLALQCAKLLGLDKNTFLAKEAHIAKIISSYHTIAYLLLQEKQWDDLLSLQIPFQNMIKLVPLIPDATEIDETFKSFTQVIVLYRYASESAPPTMYLQFGCVLATLMSQLEGYELSKLCSHLTRIITVPGAVKMDNANLCTLLDSVSFKTPYTNLSAEESIAVNTMFQKIVVYFYEKNNKEGPETLRCLVRQGLISENKLNAMKAILKAFLNSKSDTFKDYIKKCRKYLVDKALRPELTALMAGLCQLESEKRWKNNWSATNLQLLADLLEECVPYFSDKKLLPCLNVFSYMITAFPLPPTQEPWADHKVPGVKLVCSLLPKAKSIIQSLEDDSSKDRAKSVFHSMNFAIYKLVCSEYFFEAQTLLESFMQYVFFCKVSLASNPALLKDLLDCSLIAFTNQSFVSYKNKDATKERKLSLMETGSLIIAAVTYTSKFLTESEAQPLLILAMKKWCDVREKLAVTQDFGTESCKSLWEKHENLIRSRFGIEIEAPDWAEITSLEIFSYPEIGEVEEPMKSAGQVLTDYVNDTKCLDKWWNVNLAQAHAFNRDDPALALGISTCVVTKLLDALKETKTNNILAGLIQAYYQQFISEFKKYRKENEKLGEIPLISREPPLRTGPGGESNAIESWEQAPELSQLGQVLSCRSESRRINPLHLVLNNAESLLQMGLDGMNLKTVNTTLKVLECTGYIFAALGHYWLAMKCWTVLFDFAKAADNAEIQLIAVSMIVSKFCLNPDSAEETWLLQHTAELKKTVKDDSFACQFYSLSYARSLMLSNRNSAAIDIVLSVWKTSTGNTIEQRELQIRAKLLASQLMVKLPVYDSGRGLLKEEFQDPMSAAYWASNNALSYTNVKYPAERDPARLRIQELAIDAALWLNRLAILTGCYKMAVNSMQLILQKLQTLMYCSRVAQILACLGDIDLMTPDKSQLDQRLYWNQKILSLGTAIVGGKDVSEQKPHRIHTIGTSPTRFQSKKHQLTAACSLKCSKSQGGCTLCKNPLYQLCKVHYAFLVEDNEDTVMALCKQLGSDFQERADRLWMFTWKKLLPVDAPKSPQSVAGWLHLLVSPITLLECRQKLAQAAVKAAQSRPEAASLVSDIITKLQDVQHETVPLLLRWATSQHVAALMQNRGLGEFASKLKAPPMLPQATWKANVEMDHLQVEQPMPPPRTPSPPPEVKKPLPKRPGRRPTRKEPEPSIPICASLPIPKLVMPDTPKVSPAGKTKTENSVVTPKIKKPTPKTNRGKENVFSPDAAKLPKNTNKTSKTGQPFPIFSDDNTQNSVVKTGTKSSSAVSSQKKQIPESPVKSNSFKSPLKPCNGAQESPIFSAKSRRPKVIYSDTSPESPVVAKKVTATKEPGKALTYSKRTIKKTEAVRPGKKVVESPTVQKAKSLDSSISSSSSVELIESSPPIASCKRKTVIKSRLATTQSQDSASSNAASNNLTSKRKTVVKSRLPATKSHDSSSEGSILESSIIEVLPKRPTRTVTKRVK